MDDFPDDWCGLWVDEDGKAIFIKKIAPKVFKVTIVLNLLNQLHKKRLHIKKNLKNLTANWVLDINRKINRLQIEAGIENLGPTYNLYVNVSPERSNDLSKIELMPEVKMGLYDDWEDDFGVPWGFPYKSYRKAPSDLEVKFLQISRIK